MVYSVTLNHVFNPAGQDYTALTTTVTLEPGATQTSVSIDLRPDSILEGDEFFNVMISDPSGGPVVIIRDRAMVVIEDDDGECASSCICI